MNYKYDDRSFKGIEKMSFQLHCPAWQFFDSEQSYECPDGGKIIRISGWKREYPMGAFDSEDVDVALVEEND